MTIDEFELTYKDTDLLKQFYNMLTTEFKDPNEIDTFENLVYRLENKTNPDISVVKVYLNENKEMLGGTIYDYYSDIKTMGCQFTVINPKYRDHGIGSMIHRRKYELYRYYIKFMFMKLDKNSIYKDYWYNLGFRNTNIIYIQPALSENKDPCDYFELWYKPFNGAVLNMKDIDNFIEHYNKYAIELPKKKESIPE